MMRAIAIVVLLSAPAFADEKADRFSKTFFGLNVASLDTIREHFPNAEVPKTKKGMLVLESVRRSPAAEAEIKFGDIIVRVDRSLVSSNAEWRAALEDASPQKETMFEVMKLVKLKGKEQWQPAKKGKIRPTTYGAYVLKSVKASEDDIQKATFYGHADGDDDDVSVRFVKDAGGVRGLQFRLFYGGEDWVFFDKVIFAVGDDRIEYPGLKPKRDVVRGGVFERATLLIGKKELGLIDKMRSGSDHKLRFAGKDKIHDATISRLAVERMALMLDAFELMGGELPK